MNPAHVGISVRGVCKRLGANQALSDVSFSFEPGLMHGLIGPEGAGKTTLLRITQGLLHPDTGSVGYTVRDEPAAFADIRDTIAYMPQQQSLYADLSVSEHLDFFRELYGLSKEVYRTRRMRLLEATQMSAFADRPAGKLSGGMYKKLGLMCALLRSPAAVILDEPTNGVDPVSRRDFWLLLHELTAQQITVIIATAYMDEAARCDRVHLIENGLVLGEGEPRALLAKENCSDFDAYFIRRGTARSAA